MKIKLRDKYALKRRKITTERGNVSRALPDQSLTIKEVLRRFVKGMPVDAVKREPVYQDVGIDLEKLARADFGEQFELSQQFKQQAQDIEAKAEAQQRQRDEAMKNEAESKRKQKRRKTEPENESDIEDLDNTMSDDTNQITK